MSKLLRWAMGPFSGALFVMSLIGPPVVIEVDYFSLLVAAGMLYFHTLGYPEA